MEIIELKDTIKEIGRKVIFNDHLDGLVVKEYWDNHGTLIYWNKTTSYKNVDVKIVRVQMQSEYDGEPFGEPFETDELYINGKEYEGIMYIAKASGTYEKSIFKVVVGEG